MYSVLTLTLSAQVSLLRPHGAGAFGTVYQARWRGTIVAAKALKVNHPLFKFRNNAQFAAQLGRFN
jgi:hypothetical protein